MKKLALALIVGLLSTGVVLADSKNQKNQSQEDDLIHGYRPVDASKGAPAQTGSQKSQTQEDDVIYGDRTVKASKGEAPESTLHQKNQSQEDDKIYGYRN